MTNQSAAGGFTDMDRMSALLARNWWAFALRGVFSIAFGLVALLLPGLTIAALLLWFAVYMLVDGVFAIVAGVRAARHHERWGLLIFEGVADLVAAAIAVTYPLLTLFVVIVLIGAWAIVTGALLLVAGFRLHAAHGRWLMLVGGVISLLWGVLLLMAPFAGAVVLTWWLGVYALFFGIALLTLAFRLRARNRQAWHQVQPGRV